MKVFILILSCQRHRKWHQIVRDTWLDGYSVDYKFVFAGPKPSDLLSDELWLPVPDEIHNAYHKIRAVLQYALENGYDYVFKCDVDTYVSIPRLLSSGFEQRDWINMYGGTGYWLSRRAMELQLKADETDSVCEDGWVTGHMMRCGLPVFVDPRYNSHTDEGPRPGNDIITIHQFAEWNDPTDESRGYKRIISCDERVSRMWEFHWRAVRKSPTDKVKQSRRRVHHG